MYTLLLNSIDFRIILFNLQAIFRRNCLVVLFNIFHILLILHGLQHEKT